MRVILLQDVRKVGRKNEVKEVSDGYAKNYLLPQKLAKAADAGSIKAVTHLKEIQQATLLESEKEAHEAGPALKGKTFAVKVKAGEKGEMFAAFNEDNLKELIEREAGVKVKKTDLAPLKHLGSYSVNVDLGFGVTVPVTLVLEK